MARSNLPSVLQLVDMIRREEHSEQPMRHAVCESLFTSLLLSLSRSTQRANAPTQECPVQKEIDFIAENLNRKITLGEIASRTGFCSGAHLSRTPPAQAALARRTAKRV